MVGKAVTFWLNPEQDQDLIDWLNSLPKGQRSQSIRSTLRAGIGGQKKDQVYIKLDKILDKLCALSLINAASRQNEFDEGVLPDTLLATLGGLGK